MSVARSGSVATFSDDLASIRIPSVRSQCDEVARAGPAARANWSRAAGLTRDGSINVIRGRPRKLRMGVRSPISTIRGRCWTLRSRSPRMSGGADESG